MRTFIKQGLTMHFRAISAGANGAILDLSIAFFHEIENVNRNNILYVYAFFLLIESVT
jgi:hypothetical protein